MRKIIIIITRAICELASEVADGCDESRGIFDGIDCTRRQARMRPECSDVTAITPPALVFDHQFHAGRLADEAHGGGQATIFQITDEVEHPGAAYLLIIRKGY